MVPQDQISRQLVETLKYTGNVNIRQLRQYTCSLQQRELEDLIRQHAADDYGTGVYCLTNLDYYDDDTGILFEAKDYYLD